MNQWLLSLLDLFYPELCLACDERKKMPNDIWCSSCALKISPTDHHTMPQNMLKDRFYGRVELQRAGALFVFTKDSPVQQLIHKLKYEKKPEIGVELGKLYGAMLAQAEGYNIDTIVPVPMHPKKEFERGYNQATMFAKGLSEAMRKPLSTTDFIKTKSTISQTTKSRAERLDNVKDVFHIARPDKLQNKHILLVDDVITTGATLESCATLLLQLPNTKISLACIAMASSY